VTEIRVNHNPRTTGQSSYGLERIFKVGLDLIVVKFIYNYSRKPIYFFGGFATVFLTTSFLAGLFAFYLKFWGGRNLTRTPLPNLIVLTGVIGVVCILMGLLAEMIMRTYYETQNKKSYAVKESNGLRPVETVRPAEKAVPDEAGEKKADDPPEEDGFTPGVTGSAVARLASNK
jgi:dolichol-phosphate mannosyltransferase